MTTLHRTQTPDHDDRRRSAPVRMTVRVADAGDAVALAQLAELDSVAPLNTPVLVGELDGAVVAARSLRDGREAADPFVATSDVLALLRTRASKPTVHRFPRPRRPRLQVAWSG